MIGEAGSFCAQHVCAIDRLAMAIDVISDPATATIFCNVQRYNPKLIRPITIDTEDLI